MIQKENLQKEHTILMEKSHQLKLSKTSLVLFSFLLFTIVSHAQYSDAYKIYSNRYPEARKVRLNQETTITIRLIKGKFDILQEFVEEDLYLNESATYNSKRALRFSSFFELNKIKASSFSYEKDKYKEVEVKDFIQKDDLNQSFYDDTKVINFIYPNLKKGSKSKLHYSQKVKNPRFINSFYFGDYFPIIKNTVTIIVDKKIDLKLFLEFLKCNIDI